MTRAGKGSASDAQVVRSADIARLMQEWRARYEAERPWQDAKGYPHEHEPVNTLTSFERVERISVVTAWQWLAQETGMSTDSIRKISAARNGKYLMFSTADKLLMAMGMPHVDVEVLQNPVWSQERYQAWREAQGCF